MASASVQNQRSPSSTRMTELGRFHLAIAIDDIEVSGRVTVEGVERVGEHAVARRRRQGPAGCCVEHANERL